MANIDRAPTRKALSRRVNATYGNTTVRVGTKRNPYFNPSV